MVILKNAFSLLETHILNKGYTYSHSDNSCSNLDIVPTSKVFALHLKKNAVFGQRILSVNKIGNRYVLELIFE